MGLNVYAFGWRDYDPTVGRFMKIDRFSEKYPDRSLYNYAANNPVLYRDIAGDSIDIVRRKGFLGLGRKEHIRYENGNLYNKDGSAYTGKVNGFLKKAKDALSKLQAKTNGNNLVTDLQNSSQVVSIIRGSNSFTANDKKTGLSNVVRWDPNSGLGGADANLNQTRPSFIGLGHELAHGLDKIFDGKVDYSPWYTPTGATEPVRNAELFATHIENLLRAENKVNLRAFYSLGTSSSGATIGEGLILNPGTNQNANTITANNLNLVNPKY